MKEKLEIIIDAFKKVELACRKEKLDFSFVYSVLIMDKAETVKEMMHSVYGYKTTATIMIVELHSNIKKEKDNFVNF